MPLWATILIGVLPSLATIFTVINTNKKSQLKAEMKLDNLSNEIDALQKKVEAHNNYGLKIVELETEVRMLKEMSK